MYRSWGGIVILLLTSTTVLANNNNRVSNIKSHGVFHGINQDATQEVLLDSADLRYIASQLDDMEDIINGLKQQSKGNIKYIYHTHHKGDGFASSGVIYSLTNPGGCYKSAGHTHNAIETCPSHTETTHITHEHYISGNPYHCDHCGIGGYGSNTHTCTYPDTSTVWDCGSPVNTWTVQCGWREGEIEKAEIIFSPN